MTRLHLVVGPGRMEDFSQIFRTGVGVAVRVGCSLKDLLCGRRVAPGEPVDLSVVLREA